MSPTSSTQPCLSVVIATFNRRETLSETLRRLDAQTLDHSRFEVIVVDDGSSDDTATMVEALRGSLSYALRYQRHENRGPGFTQNEGIRAARYELVTLLADDIWPAPQLLERHLSSHSAHPEENVGVLGSVEQSPFLPDTVLHRFWDPFQYGRFEGRTRIDGIHFHACNVSVKKSFLLQNGLFRQHRGAAHEDIELGYRLRQQGFELVYDREALGYHHHQESIDGICRRAYERGLNFGVLSDNIPGEIIFPLYKIASFKAGARALAGMLPREALRWPLFNGVTVRTLWLPALRRVEHSRLARLFAGGASYRGVAGHFLRAGYREKQRRERGGEWAPQV